MISGVFTLSTGPHIIIIGVSFVFQVISGADISFTETPKNVTADEGIRVQLNCSATSANPSEEPIYFWKFNGNYIEDNNNNGFRPQGRTLIIEAVNGTAHQGKYECVAFKDAYGAMISLPAYLRTTYLEVSNEYSTPYYINRTSFLLIKAPTISGRPQPVLNWFYQKKNGNYEPVNNDTYVTKYGDLLIPSIPKKYGTTFKLYVTHPTEKNGTRLAAEISVIVIGPSADCFDNTIVFPVKEQDQTLNEGQSLLLECAGVAKRCSLQRTVYWEFISQGSRKQYPARLFIESVSMSNAGTYVCHTTVGNVTKEYSISITIKGKPKLLFPPPNDFEVLSSTPVNPGYAEHATNVQWYTNGEMITGSTGMIMKRQSDSSLIFKHLSNSLSGVFQIFYTNGDLTTVKSVNIFVKPQPVISGRDFGWRVSGLSGGINFKPSSSHSVGIVKYSSWLIQVPAIRTVYLTIVSPPKCAADGTTQLNIYQGSPASGISVRSVCKDSTFIPVVDKMKGPFITLVLVTSNLTGSAFSAAFDVNRPVTTQTPPTIKTTLTTTTTISPKSTSEKSTSTSFKTVSTPTTSTTETSIRTKMPGNGKDGKIIESPVGAIVGAIVGAAILIILVIIALFCYRQRQEQRKQQAPNSNFRNPEKGEILSNMPRNTYLMRRPGADPHLPCFRVQPPSGRPMPDLIPEYDTVEMEDYDEPGNETYERVEDVLRNFEHDSHGIGNLAYEPAKSPKAVMGRRIASGPGGQNSQLIRADVSPRPRDHSIMQQQLHLQDTTYDKIGDGNEYLEPVKALPRLLSMEGRPLPTPSDPSPVYQELEEEEKEQPSQPSTGMYEAPHVVPEADDSKLRNVEEELKNNEYQPLTLDRDAKAPCKHDEIGGEKGTRPAHSPIGNINNSYEGAPEDDYCDPYEPRNAGIPLSDSPNEYQPLSEYQPHSENNNHKDLEATASGCYESLDNKGKNAEDYQTLTLPRGNSDDPGQYSSI